MVLLRLLALVTGSKNNVCLKALINPKVSGEERVEAGGWWELGELRDRVQGVEGDAQQVRCKARVISYPPIRALLRYCLTEEFAEKGWTLPSLLLLFVRRFIEKQSRQFILFSIHSVYFFFFVEILFMKVVFFCAYLVAIFLEFILVFRN